MARPNKGRTLEVERIMAERIERERTERGMTYEALAKQMEAVGCAIQPSAIQKIEKSGRRIVVDEALAFSLVFDIPIAELITPEGVRAVLQLRQDLADGPTKRLAMTQYAELVQRVADHLAQHGLDDPLWEAFESKTAELTAGTDERRSLSWLFRRDVLSAYAEIEDRAETHG